MPVEEQVVSLMAGTRGFLDPIPVEDVRRFEQELLSHFRTRHGDILEAIRTTGNIPDEAALEAGVKAFAELFAPTAGAMGDAPGGIEDPGHAHMAHEAGLLPEEEIEREPEGPGH
jgi:hypothetical protein